MMTKHRIFTVGVSWCLFLGAASQATDAALTAAMRAHVQQDRFQAVTSIRGLPLGVRDELQVLFGGALDIAEPGAEFQIRRLVAAGCSIDHCLVYYQRRGAEPTWHVALFHWTPAATRFEWGGQAPAALAAIDELRKAILAGRIKGPANVW